MAARGVHFAITPAELASFLAAQGDDETLTGLVETLEETWDTNWLAESDKAWDPVHRCLTNGELEYGDTTAHKCVLGAGSLYEADSYLICPLTPAEVADVAAFMQTINETALRERYFSLDPELSGEPVSEENFPTSARTSKTLGACFKKRPMRAAQWCSPLRNSHQRVNSRSVLSNAVVIRASVSTSTLSGVSVARW